MYFKLCDIFILCLFAMSMLICPVVCGTMLYKLRFSEGFVLAGTLITFVAEFMVGAHMMKEKIGGNNQ